MLFMNRLFTFLIISILFTQSAWAFHDIELSNLHEQVYTQAGDQTETQADYDHCGHASAHLVGLIADNSFDIYIAPKNNITSVKDITLSISYQPPVPPPTT